MLILPGFSLENAQMYFEVLHFPKSRVYLHGLCSCTPYHELDEIATTTSMHSTLTESLYGLITWFTTLAAPLRLSRLRFRHCLPLSTRYMYLSRDPELEQAEAARIIGT